MPIQKFRKRRPKDERLAAVRRKLQRPQWLAEHLAEQLPEPEGMGFSSEWEDGAFWLSDQDEECIDWINAIRAVIFKGDKTTVLQLLRSDRFLSARARGHLANLLERFELKKLLPHRPRALGYEVQDETIKRFFAIDEVKRVMAQHEVNRDQAINVVADVRKIDSRALTTAYEGRDKAVEKLKKMYATQLNRPPY